MEFGCEILIRFQHVLEESLSNYFEASDCHGNYLSILLISALGLNVTF